MCLAIPGKIIKLEKGKAIVDYGTETREGKTMADDFNIGDYVIMQAGIIIQKIPKDDALKSLKLFKQPDST